MIAPVDRKAFYTPSEVAQLARVDPKTVMSWIHVGRLSAVRLSTRTYRIPLAAVVKLLYPDQVRPPTIERSARVPLPGRGERLTSPRRLASAKRAG